MPIYEYVCRDCGHELEALQRLSDAPLTDCPSCEAAALQKKVSAAGFRLKGAGWYETDFKSGNKRNVVGGEGQDKAGTADGPKAEAKADGGAKPKGDAPAKSGGDGKPPSGGKGAKAAA